MTLSRRDFVQGLGGIALLPFARTAPDLILHHGNFWTVNRAMPRAQAVAISGAGFVAVGRNDEILPLATRITRKVDLGGKTVLPGFVDAHSHPAEAGLSHLKMVDCDLRSNAAILDALRERARKTPAGDWVLGFKYDDTKTSGDPPLRRADLDAAVGAHPVFVAHRGGHTAWVNSLALDHAAGWQLGTHANGDVAIDVVLRVYERLQRELPRVDPRFRIEHCTVVDDSLVRRIRALKAIPTPFSTYVYYHGEKMKEYGPERLNQMFALRSFLDAGIPATQASDYPPGPFEPMMALQSEVTRTDMSGKLWGPRQRITVEEAIRVGTVNGAHASCEEAIKGSIEAGKVADLVVLGRDPFREQPGRLIDIPVERTMAGGRWTHGA